MTFELLARCMGFIILHKIMFWFIVIHDGMHVPIALAMWEAEAGYPEPSSLRTSWAT